MMKPQTFGTPKKVFPKIASFVSIKTISGRWATQVLAVLALKFSTIMDLKQVPLPILTKGLLQEKIVS